MNNKFLEKIYCPICRSKNYTIIMEDKYKKLDYKKIKKIYLSSSNHKLIDQLVKCKECDFVYSNPRIKINLISIGYKNNPDEMFVKQNHYRFKTFLMNFKRILNILKIKNKKNIRILDVGTGGGTFILAAKELNLNIDGLEPNKWLVNFIKNKYKINVYPGTLENFKTKHKYDMICFWDVFEHIGDLNLTLKTCKKILKKDGFILINLPDYGSIFRKILGDKWPFFLNVHLYYFQKKTLKRLMENYNFKFKKKLIHWQFLSIKYILKRAGNYYKFFNKINKLIPEKNDFGVWYNIGQSIYLFQNDKK